jgi:hypothetical protein
METLDHGHRDEELREHGKGKAVSTEENGHSKTSSAAARLPPITAYEMKGGRYQVHLGSAEDEAPCPEDSVKEYEFRSQGEFSENEMHHHAPQLPDSPHQVSRSHLLYHP